MAALINILMYAVKIEHFPGPKGMDLSANIACNMKFQNPFLQRKTRFLVSTWFRKNIGRVVCSTKLCNCCCSHHQQTAWKKWCAGVWEKELCGFWFQLCLWITLQSWASGLTSWGLDLFSSAVGWTIFSGPHLRGVFEISMRVEKMQNPWRKMAWKCNIVSSCLLEYHGFILPEIQMSYMKRV